MTIEKVTPVLMAENVQACVEFWTKLGLTPTVVLPDESDDSRAGEVAFATVSNDQIELMYQSVKSAKAQSSAVIDGVQRSILYLETNSLDSILAAIENAEIVKPEHVTPYGAREIYVRDPAGNVIGFAEQGAP